MNLIQTGVIEIKTSHISVASDNCVQTISQFVIIV